MSYSEKFDGCYEFSDLCGCWFINENARSLDCETYIDLVEYVNHLNQKIIFAHSFNVSASDVVLAKNFNRKFDKSNVCLRVTNKLIEDYKKFAGSLDVPVQDFMTFVLEFGLTHYRCVKEI